MRLCARQAKRLYQQELALKEGLPLHVMAGLTSGFCHSLFSLPMDIAKVAPTAARDLHCVATHCAALQHIALRCNTFHCVATYCAGWQHTALWVATHCIALQHIVLSCGFVCAAAHPAAPVHGRGRSRPPQRLMGHGRRLQTRMQSSQAAAAQYAYATTTRTLRACPRCRLRVCCLLSSSNQSKCRLCCTSTFLFCQPASKRSGEAWRPRARAEDLTGQACALDTARRERSSPTRACARSGRASSRISHAAAGTRVRGPFSSLDRTLSPVNSEPCTLSRGPALMLHIGRSSRPDCAKPMRVLSRGTVLRSKAGRIHWRRVHAGRFALCCLCSVYVPLPRAI
jgi:hypothetical protein